MTATNPHPLANPLNRQRYVAYEMQKPKSFLAKCNDPSKLQVPDPMPIGQMAFPNGSFASNISPTNSLTVPYSAPDDKHEMPSNIFGFIGDTSLFRLHDGSILDLKTHKVILDPNKNFKIEGYWNDPRSSMQKEHIAEWGKIDSINSILTQYEANGKHYDPNLSPESVKYWKKAQEESKKLEQNMTDEQKLLMQQLNDEQFFPMTRLKDE